jgi:uncharacterized protein (UPF0332 family)
MEPEEFQQLARTLLQGTSIGSEGSSRSAISRAYYSLYHEARRTLSKAFQHEFADGIKEWLRINRRPGTWDSSRIDLLDWEHIGKLAVNLHNVISKVLFRIEQDLGRDFKDARLQRDEADYNLSLSFSKADATVRVNQIGELIDIIHSLRGRPKFP